MANVDTQIKAPANYGDDITGTVKGSALTAQEVHQNMIVMAREFKNAQTRAGITPSNLDNTQLYQIIKKTAVETKWEEGTIIPMMKFKAPSVWDPANPDNYFPALDLSAIVTAQTIDSTGSSSGLASFPLTKIVSAKAVTWLRAFKATIREGLSTAKSDFTLASYAVVANVMTLTFAVDTDLTAMLSAIGEDALVAGASTDLKTYTASYRIPITLNSAVGPAGAGDYTITTLDPIARTVTFALVTGNTSGSSSVTCSFYPFRIVGSSTTARIFPGQGRTLVGANDGPLEVIAGLQRRDRGQGHWHTWNNSGTNGQSGGANWGIFQSNIPTINAAMPAGYITNPTADGTNGTPRTGPTSDARGLGVHLMFGLGGLTA